MTVTGYEPTDEDEAKKYEFKEKKKLAFVTQTTLSVDDTKSIISILKDRFPDKEDKYLWSFIESPIPNHWYRDEEYSTAFWKYFKISSKLRKGTQLRTWEGGGVRFWTKLENRKITIFRDLGGAGRGYGDF